MVDKLQTTNTTWVHKELAHEEQEEEEEALEFRFGASDFYNGASDDDDAHVEPIAMDPIEDHLPEDVSVHSQEASVQQSYEELCRSHVEQYLGSVENYVQDSALALRIADWRRRLQPIIAIQVHLQASIS